MFGQQSVTWVCLKLADLFKLQLYILPLNELPSIHGHGMAIFRPGGIGRSAQQWVRRLQNLPQLEVGQFQE